MHIVAVSGRADAGRPADGIVARPERDPGSSDTGATLPPVPSRKDPVPDLPARPAEATLRMVHPDRRLPATASPARRGPVGRRRPTRHTEGTPPLSGKQSAFPRAGAAVDNLDSLDSLTFKGGVSCAMDRWYLRNWRIGRISP